MDIKERFAKTDELNSFQRVDETHILDIYLGIDSMSRNTLFLISESEPLQMYSSQIINVNVGVRKDKKWGISFSLIKDGFEDLFCHFCTDIIESSRLLKKKSKGAEFICTRYINWQNMLTRLKNGLLAPSAIKGLIGELYFLKYYLIPLYGQEIAVNSWIGPEKADQDFVCGSTWYEVKASVSGAENVKISSVEQLDAMIDGQLAIVYLDKTSFTDENKITLNSIYKMIYDSMETELLKQMLSDIVLNLGYYQRSEYDEYMFKFTKMDRYNVNSEFPCIRKNILPFAVVNTKYELSISSINNFLRG